MTYQLRQLNYQGGAVDMWHTSPLRVHHDPEEKYPCQAPLTDILLDEDFNSLDNNNALGRFPDISLNTNKAAGNRIHQFPMTMPSFPSGEEANEALIFIPGNNELKIYFKLPILYIIARLLRRYASTLAWITAQEFSHNFLHW